MAATFSLALAAAMAMLFALAAPLRAETSASRSGGWPTLRGDPSRCGFSKTNLPVPLRLAWACEIDGERLGSAMEPIVSEGRLFLATHTGNLFALNADTGEPLWRFQALGPFLHSPAAANGLIVAASADGRLYALDAASGALRWSWFGGAGGFSASPAIENGIAYIGSRAGEFAAVRLSDGELVWRRALNAPVRQTAAIYEGKIYVTAEDLCARCFNADDGNLLWTSEPLAGQTARDYYPAVFKRDGRAFVVIRTNPLLNMGQRIGRDRALLCANAGIDSRDWKTVDAWIKSDRARGDAGLWAREQDAIIRYLEANREAQTFFMLDGLTGKETPPAPVLWAAGCQGVGAPPALTGDGRLLVYYRSAYGNWNHGVAPLVALGLLDAGENKIAPLFHSQGAQPRWNCFWGTADESQNFFTFGKTVLIAHQGTLSAFDLEKNELFAICGNRDTFGGFRGLPWARNEWHGPARGGAALANARLYWLTGSRALCLVQGRSAPNAESPKPQTISASRVACPSAPPPLPAASAEEIRRRLIALAEEILSKRWAPLFCDPGLAGRVFSFDSSADLFEALARAYPYFPEELQQKAKTILREEWAGRAPFASEGSYSLKEGARREFFKTPEEFLARLGGDKQPHPFGGVYAACLYAGRCGNEKSAQESWPRIKAAYEGFIQSGWKLDPAKGDAYANRYLASLLAFHGLAEKMGDAAAAQSAQTKAGETERALVAWWNRAAGQSARQSHKSVNELDNFIGKGDGLFYAMAPHRHTLALFQDLTPEIAARLKSQAPASCEEVWKTFETLCRTWRLTGEEHQVHTGENFLDPPVFALSGFWALAWLRGAKGEELAQSADLPYGRADLYHLIKLSICLDALKP